MYIYIYTRIICPVMKCVHNNFALSADNEHRGWKQVGTLPPEQT